MRVFSPRMEDSDLTSLMVERPNGGLELPRRDDIWRMKDLAAKLPRTAFSGWGKAMVPSYRRRVKLGFEDQAPDLWLCNSCSHSSIVTF